MADSLLERNSYAKQICIQVGGQDEAKERRKEEN